MTGVICPNRQLEWDIACKLIYIYVGKICNFLSLFSKKLQLIHCFLEQFLAKIQFSCTFVQEAEVCEGACYLVHVIITSLKPNTNVLVRYWYQSLEETLLA